MWSGKIKTVRFGDLLKVTNLVSGQDRNMKTNKHCLLRTWYILPRSMIRPSMATGNSGKWSRGPTGPNTREWMCLVPLPSGWRERPFCGITPPNLFASSPSAKDLLFSTRPSYSQDSWSHGHIGNSPLLVLCPHLHGIQVSSPFKSDPSQTDTWSDIYGILKESNS